MLTLSSGNKYYSESEYNRIKEKLELVQADFTTVARALRDEAERREWCSDYNEFANVVNDSLALMALIQLDREYKVDITFTRTQTLNVTVDITAMSSDDLEQLINDMGFDELICLAQVDEEDWENEDEDYEVNDIQDT